MSLTPKQFLLSHPDATRAMEMFISSSDAGRVTRNLNRRVVRQLIDDLSEPTLSGENHFTLSSDRLAAWMIRDMQGRKHGHVRQQFGVIRRFLQLLTKTGFLEPHALADLGPCGGGVALKAVLAALQADDPQAALTSLAAPPSGPLAASIASYLALQHALGKQYRSNRYDLLDFNRFLERTNVSTILDIDAAVVQQWIQPMPCIAVVRARKLHLLRRFFDFLVGTGVLQANPVVGPLLDSYRRASTSIPPFIFSPEQIKAILNQARQLCRTVLFPLRPESCYTMIALLYGLGLRCGEVLRLKMRDLDLSQQALFIRETKFHKNRYVPFGPKLGGCLDAFLIARRKHLTPVREDDPLFVTSWRAPIHDTTIRASFAEILATLGITAGHERRSLRLHDLRHSFAVHRLTRWYREGVDVQSRLPILSTFLGHSEVKNTQVYLNATEELLQQAGARFYDHFGNSLLEDTFSCTTTS